MSQEKWDDIYDRLTSRKLWLALLSILFALWNYAEGRLSAVEFQVAVFAAVTAYTASEGLTDAVAAYRPRPSGPEQTVEVNTQPVATGLVPRTPVPTPRVRPSRAKAKV